MSTGPSADGRRARGARSRAAVARAVLSLLEEGNLRPTRQEVAERAGVSLRLVHHHFRQREELYAAAARLQNERISRGIVGIDIAGDFASRLDAFVAARAAVLEAITPVRRAAQLEEPFSVTAQTSLAAWRRLKRDQVAQVFAVELAAADASSRDELAAAAACAASWATWDELRRNQGLEPAAARRIMARTLGALFEGGRS